MPPVFGPLSPSTDALVVLRRGERDRGLAVAQREERRLLADEKLLDHHLGAGLAQAAAEHHVDRGFGLGDVSAMITPLPAASPSALMTIGVPCLRT